MKHKKVLNNLYKEHGIVYSDLNQVSSAIKICEEKIITLNEDLISIGNYHNDILDSLLSCSLINEVDCNKFYNKTTTTSLLVELINILNNNCNSGNYSEEKIHILYEIKEYIYQLHIRLLENNYYKKEIKEERKRIYKDLNLALKEMNALCYAKNNLVE